MLNLVIGRGDTEVGNRTSRVAVTVALLHAWRGQGRCGVADYTERLAQALRSRGVSAYALCMPDWTLSSVRAVHRTLIDRQPGELILHLQYPSLDAGRSLWPAALRLTMPAAPLVVTFHEFEAFHPLRKAALAICAAQAGAAVLTNEHDRRSFERWYSFARGCTHVIPVGSNIALRRNVPEVTRTIAASFFGQLRRNRGLEAFFAFAKALRGHDARSAIVCIGAIVDPDPSFERWLSENARAHGVDLRVNVRAESVSDLLSASTLAYLPFPDGLSERRGSVLACLDHGVMVLSTHTRHTPPWLRAATVHTTSPEHAAEQAKDLLDGTREPPGADIEVQRERRARQWPTIAARHCALYQTVAGIHANARVRDGGYGSRKAR